MSEVDRIEAEEIADRLGITVAAIPEDHDALTAQLWDVLGLNSELLPETIEIRWVFIALAISGER
jgi:hypothetical protein